MKQLEYLVIHCSDTPLNRDVKAEEIVEWHTSKPPRGNGWSRPGYSDVIELDGTLVNIRQYNNDGWVQADEVTNGARGYNDVSRHICYIGGRNITGNHADTRTKEQIETMEKICIQTKLGHPNIKIIGHNDLNPHKKCPAFFVERWFTKVWQQYQQQVHLGNIGSLDPKSQKRI